MIAAPHTEHVFRLHRRSLVMPLISACFVVGGIALLVLGNVSFDYRLLTIGVGVAVRIVQVVTTRVVVTSDRVRATWGWLWTSDKSIPLDRVQDVEIQRSLIARILGLTQVEISSAGAGGSIKLSYFDLAEAGRFRDLLIAAGLESAPAPGDLVDTPGTSGRPTLVANAPERPIHAVTVAEIGRSVAVAATLGALALVLGLVLAVLVHPVAILPGIGLLFLAAAKAVSTWLTIGPGETTIRGDLLHTRQGVITLRGTNTPLKRLQILGAVAGPAYQLMGAQRVSFASADAAVASSERVRTQISPGAPQGLVDVLVEPLLGVGPPTPDRRAPLGGRVVSSTALREAIRGALVAPALLAIGSLAAAIVALGLDEMAGARAIGVLALLVAALAPVAAGLVGAFAGWVRSQRSWIAVDDDCLVVHDGVWRLRTIAVPLAKVQAVEIATDPAQRRCRTAGIMIDVAGVSGRWALRVTDLDEDRALALRDRIVPVATRVLLPDGV